jgi:hypothetical protein
MESVAAAMLVAGPMLLERAALLVEEMSKLRWAIGEVDEETTTLFDEVNETLP